MEAIKEFLGKGSLILDNKNQVIRFNMESFVDINQLLVPLFKDHPLQSGKVKDYSDFIKALDIINNKEHLTENGFLKLLEIKSQMNFQRVELDSEDILSD